MKKSFILSRCFFTIAVLFLYQLIGYVKVPFICDVLTENNSFNIILKEGMRDSSIFLVGMKPYIISQAVLNALGIVFGYFKNLSKQGLHGAKIIDLYSRILSMFLACIYGILHLMYLRSSNRAPDDLWFFIFYIFVVLSSNSFLIWLSDKLTENGFGVGSSLIICSNILVSESINIFNVFGNKDLYSLFFNIIVILLIILYENLSFNIDIIIPKYFAYKSNKVGFEDIINKNSFLPIKIGLTGINSAFIGHFVLFFINRYLPVSQIVAVLLIFFVLFLLNIATSYHLLKPDEISDILFKNGSIFNGVRPGFATEIAISKLIIFMSLISSLYILFMIYGLDMVFSFFCAKKMVSSGFSFVILVSTSIDIYKQMRCHYKQYIVNNRI